MDYPSICNQNVAGVQLILESSLDMFAHFSSLLLPALGLPGRKYEMATTMRHGGDMKTKLLALFLCLGFSVAALMAARQVWGALGESAESVASDRKALSAVQRATITHRNYTVKELVSGSTTVREYISPDGIVFAIAWNGRTYPDLTPLLGEYAAEYDEALKQMPRKKGGRRAQVVKTERVVVEKWGHMRNLQGRAYAPALIPSGVTLDEIK
jgi:Protein of unknown function (DUF2844)